MQKHDGYCLAFSLSKVLRKSLSQRICLGLQRSEVSQVTKETLQVRSGVNNLFRCRAQICNFVFTRKLYKRCELGWQLIFFFSSFWPRPLKQNLCQIGALLTWIPPVWHGIAYKEGASLYLTNFCHQRLIVNVQSSISWHGLCGSLSCFFSFSFLLNHLYGIFQWISRSFHQWLYPATKSWNAIIV